MANPLTIPKNDNELARDWAKFIAQTLRNRNRISFNFEDVFQDILLKLVMSKVVEKFWAGVAERSHPLTVTAEEAANMLGISLGEFISFQIESKDSLAPVNGKGQPIPDGLGYSSPGALYLFADVIVLGASVVFAGQGVQQLPPPKDPTVSQFRAYLLVAIHNHVSNVCRRHSRKFNKEHAPDHFACFRTSEGTIEFEGSLIDDEAVSDIENGAEAGLMFRRTPGIMTKKSKDEKTVFDLIHEGYSIAEAAKACRLTRHELRVLTRELSFDSS